MIARPLSGFNTPNQASRSFRISRFHRAFEARDTIINCQSSVAPRYEPVFLPLFLARFSSVSSVDSNRRSCHTQTACTTNRYSDAQTKLSTGNTTGFTLYADDAQTPRLFQLSLKYHVVRYVRAFVHVLRVVCLTKLEGENERDDWLLILLNAWSFELVNFRIFGFNQIYVPLSKVETKVWRKML